MYYDDQCCAANAYKHIKQSLYRGYRILRNRRMTETNKVHKPRLLIQCIQSALKSIDHDSSEASAIRLVNRAKAVTKKAAEDVREYWTVR